MDALFNTTGVLGEAARKAAKYWHEINRLVVEQHSMKASEALSKASDRLPWTARRPSEEAFEGLFKSRIMEISQRPEEFAYDTPASLTVDVASAISAGAGAVLEADPVLRQLRFRLVPAHISEEAFWRRYFAAVARVRAQVLLSEMTEDNDFMRVPSLGDILTDEQMADLSEQHTAQNQHHSAHDCHDRAKPGMQPSSSHHMTDLWHHGHSEPQTQQQQQQQDGVCMDSQTDTYMVLSGHSECGAVANYHPQAGSAANIHAPDQRGLSQEQSSGAVSGAHANGNVHTCTGHLGGSVEAACFLNEDVEMVSSPTDRCLELEHRLAETDSATSTMIAARVLPCPPAEPSNANTLATSNDTAYLPSVSCSSALQAAAMQISITPTPDPHCGSRITAQTQVVADEPESAPAQSRGRRRNGRGVDAAVGRPRAWRRVTRRHNSGVPFDAAGLRRLADMLMSARQGQGDSAQDAEGNNSACSQAAAVMEAAVPAFQVRNEESTAAEACCADSNDRIVSLVREAFGAEAEQCKRADFAGMGSSAGPTEGRPCEHIAGVPLGGLLARTAVSALELESVEQFCSFWHHWLQELRRRWDSLQPVPFVPHESLPERHLAPLQQQLQLLNCCRAQQRRSNTGDAHCQPSTGGCEAGHFEGKGIKTPKNSAATMGASMLHNIANQALSDVLEQVFAAGICASISAAAARIAVHGNETLRGSVAEVTSFLVASCRRPLSGALAARICQVFDRLEEVFLVDHADHTHSSSSSNSSNCSSNTGAPGLHPVAVPCCGVALAASDAAAEQPMGAAGAAYVDQVDCEGWTLL